MIRDLSLDYRGDHLLEQDYSGLSLSDSSEPSEPPI